MRFKLSSNGSRKAGNEVCQRAPVPLCGLPAPFVPPACAHGAISAVLRLPPEAVKEVGGLLRFASARFRALSRDSGAAIWMLPDVSPGLPAPFGAALRAACGRLSRSARFPIIRRDSRPAIPSLPNVSRDSRPAIPNLPNVSRDSRLAIRSLPILSRDSRLAIPSLPILSRDSRPAIRSLPTLSRDSRPAIPSLPIVSRDSRPAIPSLPIVSRDSRPAIPSLPILSRDSRPAIPSLPILSRDSRPAIPSLPILSRDSRPAIPSLPILSRDCQRPPALPFGLPAAGYAAPLHSRTSAEIYRLASPSQFDAILNIKQLAYARMF
jgi:hypothetical protein